MSEFPSLERSSAVPVKTTYLNVLKPLKTVYFIKINKKRYTQKQVIHFLEEKRHFSLCQDNSHLAHSASDSQHTGTSEVESQTYLIPALAFSSATLKALSYTQLLPKLIIWILVPVICTHETENAVFPHARRFYKVSMWNYLLKA